MNQQIAERLRDIVCARLSVKPEDVTPAVSLVGDLGADSLDIVDLVFSVEEAFSVRIPERDYPQMMLISDAVSYIEACLQEQSVPMQAATAALNP